MFNEEKRCQPLGDLVEDGFKYEGGCDHKVKVFYEDKTTGEKTLPYGYDPFGKLGWRMPAGTRLTGYDKEEGYYEFEATADRLESGIDYLRAFGKQRDHKATKVEIEFMDDREVRPSD